jgi:mRNA-degrading endonuclease HigB of HigAB toxin-antitoxin module
MGLSFREQLLNYLSNIENTFFKYPEDMYLILGDFNMSGISWIFNSAENSYTTTNTTCPNEQLFIDELCTHDLNQYNGLVNCYGRILDLVLSNTKVEVRE